MKNSLIVTEFIEKPIELLWEYWTNPDYIKLWNIPYDDWHCPSVQIDFREGGVFNYRMEKMDGSEGFNYAGVFESIIPFESILTITDDNRKNLVEFQSVGNNTIMRETFEPVGNTPLDIQQEFVESVYKRFKKIVEEL